MAYEVKARIIGYADYETVDLSNGDHVFRRGVTDAIYADQDAEVVLSIAGRSESWSLQRGITQLEVHSVIQAGTDVGVRIRGLYRRSRV